MAAVHQVNAAYYGCIGYEHHGHPDDKWGFVVGAGIKLNAPMIGQGDYFQAQVTYTQGRSSTLQDNAGQLGLTQDGDSAAIGTVFDAVFGGSSSRGLPPISN